MTAVVSEVQQTSSHSLTLAFLEQTKQPTNNKQKNKMQIQINTRTQKQESKSATNKSKNVSMDKFFGRYRHSETSSRGYRNQPRRNYATVPYVA